MIDQAQILKKALVSWNSGAFLSACLRNTSIFPIEIRFRSPGGKELLDNFESVRTWIQTLKYHSKEIQKNGYEIVWQAVNHRSLGGQLIPQKIFFSNPPDWLAYIKKTKEYQLFLDLVSQTQDTLPDLLPFVENYPLRALANAPHWSLLMNVCGFFKTNPRPDRYIRQLEIIGVDTKFIEFHKAILMDLLPLVMKSDEYQEDIHGLAKHGFERKFGLKYDPPLVRLRLLDPDLVLNGLSDLTVPLAQLAKNDLGASQIFITENKINGLSFPQVKGALVIFGLGYGVEMLPEINWLNAKSIYYWGDIDTHGFAILSQIRSYFKNVQAMLMDRQTLADHRHLWVTEDPAKRFTGQAPHLTPDESDLFNKLKQNTLGQNIRLEQERIHFTALLEQMQCIAKIKSENNF